ncbi:MAG: hypothetical protein AB2L14_10060 [Candidatus Xenobiia bacterium LiM19]
MQQIRLETSLAQKTHTAIQMSLFFERWRKGFWSHVREVESRELFLKLCTPVEKGNKALFITPRHLSRLIESSGSPSSLSFDIEDSLDHHSSKVEKLKSLGREAFSAIFLGDGDDGYTPMELAELTGLTIEELKSFQDEVLTPATIQDLAAPSRMPVAARRQYEKVALIKQEGEEIQCLFLSDKKRYRIDEEKITRLSKEGLLNEEEKEAWKELKTELEQINSRIGLINDIVLAVVNAQRLFLLSGLEEDQRPLEGKEAAHMLSIDAGWLCRLIQGKSIVTPHGEKALQSLFLPRRKAGRQRGMRLLKKLMAAHEGQLINDIELQKLLEKDYGLTVSRRTVNDWRRALESSLL